MTTTNLGTQFREIEEAREEHVQPSFMVTLFEGAPDFSLLFPYPAQPGEDLIRFDGHGCSPRPDAISILVLWARAVNEVWFRVTDGGVNL